MRALAWSCVIILIEATSISSSIQKVTKLERNF